MTSFAKSGFGLVCMLGVGAVFPAHRVGMMDRPVLVTAPELVARRASTQQRDEPSTKVAVSAAHMAESAIDVGDAAPPSDADQLRLRLIKALQQLQTPPEMEVKAVDAALVWPVTPPVDEDAQPSSPSRLLSVPDPDRIATATVSVARLLQLEASESHLDSPGPFPPLQATPQVEAVVLPLPMGKLAASAPALEPATAALAAAAVVVRPKAAPRRSVGILGGTRVALSEQSLGAIRGGFSGVNGLQVSFGIERTVYINGDLVATTSLNVSPQGQVVGSGESLALIQTGVGNSFAPQIILPSSMPATVIQNTLNDQRIQALTVINATVSSMQMLRSLEFQASMRDAVTGSLRK